MKEKVKSRSKAKLWVAITVGITAAIVLIIFIVNFFIPVKYIASYCVSRSRAPADTMRVSFVDVGYGDCIIIELPDGKTALIDAGDGSLTNNAKILKELNRRDISKINYLICSSVNNEHCGGLDTIMKYKAFDTVYLPYCKNYYVTEGFEAFTHSIEASNANVIFNEYNVKIDGDKYRFTFLSPSLINSPKGEYAELNKAPAITARNNASAIIWLEYGETAFLFASDAGKSVLKSIVDSYELIGEDYPVGLSKCKIVLVAGHGGSWAECAEFYDTLKPEAAILSVGVNGAGCPSGGAISNVVNSVGKNFYRTDERGTIIVEVTATEYMIK